MTDDRIAEIREWRQHAYEWGSLSKAEATAIDDLLAEIDRLRKLAYSDTDETYQDRFRNSAEAGMELIDKLSAAEATIARLRVQVAQQLQATRDVDDLRMREISDLSATIARVEEMAREVNNADLFGHDMVPASDLLAALSAVREDQP